MLSGILWGARERVHADAGTFEKLFQKELKEDSFFGRKMWLAKYKYENRIISQLLNWLPVNDYWHASWYTIKILYVIGFYTSFKAGTSFLTLSNFWPLLLWVTLITMFWGGLTNWLIKVKIKKNETS